MKTYEEMKDIVLKLEFIDGMKETLQSLLDDFNTLLQKGKSWTQDQDSQIYEEMKQSLESEIAELIRRCFCIASKGHERFSETALTEEQVNQASKIVTVEMTRTRSADDKDTELILGKIDELNENFKSHTEMLNTIQQTIKEHKRKIYSASKHNQKTTAQYERMEQEFQSASNYMSELSEELNEMKEKEQILDEKIQKISGTVVNYSEERDSIANEQEVDEDTKEEMKRLTDELDAANKRLVSQEYEMRALKAEEAHVFEVIKLKEQGIDNLLTENAKVQEALRNRVQENDRLLKDYAEVMENLRIKVQENERLQNDYAEAMKDLKLKETELVTQMETNAQAIKDVETKEAEILKLKEEIDTAKEAANFNDNPICKLIKVKDLRSCVESALKCRGLDDEDIAAFWHGINTSNTKLNYMPDISRRKYSRKIDVLRAYYEKWMDHGFSGADLEQAIVIFIIIIGLSFAECVTFKNEYLKYQNDL